MARFNIGRAVRGGLQGFRTGLQLTRLLDEREEKDRKKQLSEEIFDFIQRTSKSESQIFDDARTRASTMPGVGTLLGTNETNQVGARNPFMDIALEGQAEELTSGADDITSRIGELVGDPEQARALSAGIAGQEQNLREQVRDMQNIPETFDLAISRLKETNTPQSRIDTLNKLFQQDPRLALEEALKEEKARFEDFAGAQSRAFGEIVAQGTEEFTKNLIVRGRIETGFKERWLRSKQKILSEDPGQVLKGMREMSGEMSDSAIDNLKDKKKAYFNARDAADEAIDGFTISLDDAFQPITEQVIPFRDIVGAVHANNGDVRTALDQFGLEVGDKILDTVRTRYNEVIDAPGGATVAKRLGEEYTANLTRAQAGKMAIQTHIANQIYSGVTSADELEAMRESGDFSALKPSREDLKAIVGSSFVNSIHPEQLNVWVDSALETVLRKVDPLSPEAAGEAAEYNEGIATGESTSTKPEVGAVRANIPLPGETGLREQATVEPPPPMFGLTDDPTPEQLAQAINRANETPFISNEAEDIVSGMKNRSTLWGKIKSGELDIRMVIDRLVQDGKLDASDSLNLMEVIISEIAEEAGLTNQQVADKLAKRESIGTDTKGRDRVQKLKTAAEQAEQEKKQRFLEASENIGATFLQRLQRSALQDTREAEENNQ